MSRRFVLVDVVVRSFRLMCGFVDRPADDAGPAARSGLFNALTAKG